jgi:predicted nucleotidyltransferase
LSIVNSISEAILINIQSILSHHPKVVSAVLYGSHAKGTAKTRSDIDLAIKGEALNRFDIADLTLAFDDSDIILQVDLQNYHDIKNIHLKEHIDRVGIELYRIASSRL